MRNKTRGRIILKASVFQIRFQIRVWLTLFVLAPTMGFTASDNKEALGLAQSFANEFAIAQAGGADLSKIRGVRSAIETLTRGVAGGGNHAELIFRVEDVSAEDAKLAADYLSYDRNILRYRPPLHYTTAWTKGTIKQKNARYGQALRRLLAERTAQSFARVYSAARAAGADLSRTNNVQSAMILLEKGVRGQSTHSNTNFQLPSPDANTRFAAKKLLRFENGHLHYIKDADRLSPDQVKRKIRETRPAQLAQQVVALYNSAVGSGATFENAKTPAEVVDALRFGEELKSELGTRVFRLSTEANESDWNRCVAYLRLRGRTLSYTPPSNR